VPADPMMPGPSPGELAARADLAKLFLGSPIPVADRLENLMLYLRPQVFSLALGLSEIYRRILGQHGVIFDLGTRYGRNMAVFSSLRRIYEPYNHFRKIIGFDTFHGFPAVSAEDGTSEYVRVGCFDVPANYREHLCAILDYHERESPLGHIRRFEIRPGDVAAEVPRYLSEHPETIVALAYFDLDLYHPTKAALEALLPHTAKGTVLVFDELMHARFPGETIALKEVLDVRDYRIERSPHRGHPAFIVLE
jgi:hypothetical protein